MLNSIRNWISRWFASTASNPSNWFVEWVRGTSSDSGVTFNRETPLTYSPIWYAVNKIAGHVGVMPLVLYQRTTDGQDRAVKHPAFRLMKARPNQWMSAHVFKETLTSHALLWGNGRAAITRGANPRLDIIDPVRTSCVKIRNTETDVTEKWHVYIDDETHEQMAWPDRDVLHIQGLGTDGFVGYSVVELAKNSWGLGLASEKSTNRLFKNNAVPELILEAPVGAFRKKEEAEEFLRRFKEHHEGGGGVGLLREGIQAKPLTMSGRDAQWLDQRKFQRQDAALWMLLEQILGDDSSVSYNSLEQKNLAYLTNCLLRWLVKWEEECNAKLLTEQQQRNDTHFFKFTTAALLRGTTKERYEVYQIGRQIEVLSANDVRRLEDMNPREGGDDYSNPAINPKDKNSDGKVDETFQNNALSLIAYEKSSERCHLRKLINTRLTKLVNDEVRRVREAASKHVAWVKHKQGNFIDWMDNFYPSFEARVASATDSDEVAKLYVEESRNLLLDVAGRSTDDELSDLIVSETSTWLDRVAVWTDSILEKDNG